MKVSFLLPLFCLSLLFEECWTLKCRTGNQQTNEQFRKVMQTCRRRNLSNGRNGDLSDESHSSNESDSEEDMFDKRFLSGLNRKNNTSSYNGNGSNNRRRFDAKENRQSWRRQSSFNENNMKNRQNADKNNSDTDNRYGRNSETNNEMNFQNNRNNNNDDQRGPACVIQCFFNELNLVDRRGFPEANSVTGIMTENIQDPELRDFVEESITECFHYLRTDINQDKCKFSQNLLSCLADKGSERCDDWNDTNNK